MESSDDKLKTARDEFDQHLTEMSRKLTRLPGRSSFVVPSINTLYAAPPSKIYSSQDPSGSCNESAVPEGYRCKCSFQLVPISSVCTHLNELNEQSPQDLIYSIRERGNILPLENGIFPHANRRIRIDMASLIECLNTKKSTEIDGGYQFRGVRNNLTSVTFVSSWGDGAAQHALSGDCHVTLHYGPPGIFNGSSSNTITKDQYSELMWKEEAQKICDECNLSSLTARSKGVKISVLNSKLNQEGNSLVIHDDLWIAMQQNADIPEILGVTLVSPEQSSDEASCQSDHIKVRYHKSIEAFQHPNAGVMLTSLHWILNKLSQIARQLATANAAARKPRLLEMYCGCGAHTIPCAKSGILSEIVAVELDERLVAACKNNCLLNNCLKEVAENTGTHVSVYKGDAATWAKKTLISYKKQTLTTQSCSSKNTTDFDILLVDPPREGLDETVCELALKGQFQHLIYVSCGRRALLRDLEILCTGGFDVVDLAVIDLFPGTDAVESLVHLSRPV